MMRAHRRFMFVATVAVVSTMVWANHGQAKLFQAKKMEPVPQAAAPGPAAVADCCCPKRCITYRNHKLCRRICCDPCQPPVQTVLQVKDPCTCCTVDVPVCVPACCTGAPCVSTRCGLFGRTITEFEWCCGFRVKAVMSRGGDIVVHTYGR